MKLLITTLSTLLFIQTTSALAQTSPEKLAAVTRAWDAHPNFSSTDLILVDEEMPTNENTIPLTIIHLKNSNWSLDDVEARLNRTRDIYYRECRIKFSPILIASVVHKKGASFKMINDNGLVSTKYLSTDSLVNQKAAFKPVIFMTDKDLSHTGYGGGAAVPLINTVTLFENKAKRQRSSSSAKKVKGHSEVMAHELAHLFLSTVDHDTKPGNIFSSFEDRTNQITNDQ